MKRSGFFGVGMIALASAAIACGGTGGVAPGTRNAAAVQSAGMQSTFAGQNKCSAKSHERPFIIEWDATDMSSFESRAANDVVFVRYEGCELTILDGCVDESVRGSFGSYKPVEWTSGSLEAMDINDEGDLYAKLPLGAASLAGRVEGGEKFHMEYFVSGTRTATRPTIHRADLDKNPACKGATHFVYAYNLGAFALGAQSNLKASVGGSAFGFGAGGSRATASRADKAGGLLASCRGDSAKEVSTCKVPIRLTLRALSDGENADARAAKADETPEARNLAGKLKAETDREKKAAEHLEAARAKMSSGDGKSCLGELDQHDKLDPRPAGLSTKPGWTGQLRAQCLMLSGQCNPGKALMRKSLEQGESAKWGPEVMDKQVEQASSQYCQGAMSPRDALLRAWMDLQMGVAAKKDVPYCDSRYSTVKRLRTQVKPNDEQDYQVIATQNSAGDTAAGCYVKAGDCDKAWSVWREEESARVAAHVSSTGGILTGDPAPRARFDNIFPKCKR